MLGMKPRDLRSWHRFIYGLLYPAVLGSMLYDVLHLTPSHGPLRMVALSITWLYCVDFLYLASDLGSDRYPKGTWRDAIFDGGISITFGVAYWQASDNQLTAAFGCMIAISLAIVYYNCEPSRMTGFRIGWLAVMVLLYLLLFGLARRGGIVGWPGAIAAWVPAAWYTVYVFHIVNRSTPEMASENLPPGPGTASTAGGSSVEPPGTG